MDQQRFFTEAGHLTELGTALFADGLTLGRTTELPTDLLRHIEACDDCKRRIMDVTEVVTEAGLDQWTRHPYFDGVRREKRPSPQWYRAAAILALAFGIRTAYIAMEPSELVVTHSGPRSVGDVTDEHRSVMPPAASAVEDRFRPSATLEDLLHTEFRSSSLEALAPTNGSTVRSPITFRWKHAGGAVKIKILTNREIAVQTAIVRTGSFRTEKKFEPGLYYWKLEQEGEIRHLGSFFIR